MIPPRERLGNPPRIQRDNLVPHVDSRNGHHLTQLTATDNSDCFRWAPLVDSSAIFFPCSSAKSANAIAIADHLLKGDGGQKRAAFVAPCFTDSHRNRHTTWHLDDRVEWVHATKSARLRLEIDDRFSHVSILANGLRLQHRNNDLDTAIKPPHVWIWGLESVGEGAHENRTTFCLLREVTVGRYLLSPG